MGDVKVIIDNQTATNTFINAIQDIKCEISHMNTKSENLLITVDNNAKALERVTSEHEKLKEKIEVNAENEEFMKTIKSDISGVNEVNKGLQRRMSQIETKVEELANNQ